jgi:hypothetical protein
MCANSWPDEHAIVSWHYLQQPRRWTWLLLRASLPYDEYNRMVDALNSYVVARTGLPLYDLRMNALQDVPIARENQLER